MSSSYAVLTQRLKLLIVPAAHENVLVPQGLSCAVC